VKNRKPPEPEAVHDAARGHHYRTFFSTIRATGLAATWGSCVRGEVLYNASARRTADERWIASRNGSSAGNRGVI
jgi:hypothetical protein